MASKPSKEKQLEYRETVRARSKQARRELLKRQARAWQLAHQAARLLRERFRAERVVLFGSLAQGTFTLWSDVDLAVWGLRPEDTFRAIQAVLALDRDIQVNLVDVQTCSAPLREIIEREGVEL